MIVESTASGCYRQYSDLLNAFFTTLQGRELASFIRPSFPVIEEAGDVLRVYHPKRPRQRLDMATPDQVFTLLSTHEKQAFVFTERPLVLLSYEEMIAVPVSAQSPSGPFKLRTQHYQHILLIASHHGLDPQHEYYAVRIESDGAFSRNSWFLNHPLHHIQLGFDEAFRWPSTPYMSTLGVLDFLLCVFAEGAWKRLYPSLHGLLSARRGGDSGPVNSPADFPALVRATECGLKPSWRLDWELWQRRVSATSTLPDYHGLYQAPLDAA